MNDLAPDEPMRGDRLRPRWLGYAAAVAAVVVATLIRLALDRLFGDGFPFTTYFLAAALIAGFWRTREAVLTLVVGGLLGVYLFAPPRHSFPVTDPNVLLGLSIYLTVGSVIVVMSHAMRVARRRTEALLTEAVAREGEVRGAMQAEAEQRERLRTTLASIGDAVITTDMAGRVTSLNPVAEMLTGWATPDAAGQPLGTVFVIVNETTRQPVENPAFRALKEGVIVGLANHTVLIARDGTERPIDDSAAPIRCKAGEVVGSVLVFRDVTERRRAESLLTDQNRVLQQMLRGGPLADVLEELCEAAEGQTAVGGIATVLLMDAGGTLLRPAAGRRAPAAYSEAINPVPVGPACGSCGTAAYRGEPVVVADIATDPLWADYRAAALPHGLRACWSVPIPSSAGAVLGTFAVYSPAPGRPSDHDLRVMEFLARTAGLAVERRRAEEAVREAHSRLESTLTAGEVGTWEFDVVNNTVRADPNLASMFGVAPGEAAGGPLDSYTRAIHPDDRDRVTETIGRALAAGNGYEADYRLVGPDGVGRWVVARGRVERDGAGRAVRLPGVVVDITKQRQAEESLRASEERNTFLVALADTLRPLSDPIAVQAEASRVLGERLGANRVVYFEVRGDEYVVQRDYASSVPSVVGCHTIAAFGPDQLAIYQSGRTAAEADVDALPSRPGAEKAAFAGVQIRSYIGVPLVKNGLFVAGLAVHADRVRAWTPTEITITEDTAERTWAAVERVRAEAEVARIAAEADRERRLFAAVLSSTPDFIYTFDLAGRFVYVNAALLALWGKRPDEAVGRNFHDLDYPPALADRLQRQIRQVIDTQQPVRDETPYTSGLGERMYEYIFVPVVGADGAVEAVAGSTRDITDRKRAEEELRRLAADLSEADRRKDEFLATLAHELRNPLAPLRNGLQIIGLSGPNGAVEKARTMMDRQLTQMVRLVDDLLDVSRITRGKLELRTERVELRGVIDAAVETSRPLIEQAGHELAVVVPDEPILVDGDATRLAQVVSNLLTNSAKYTYQGGHIRLTVRRNDGSVAVSVADDGIGIPPSMLDKVFVMFTQVDRTLEKTTGGLGIGLSLVKGLVEMHDGTVAAKSEGEGRGSEFVVTLPIAVPAAGTADPADGRAEEVVTPGLRRILVVDDNTDSADSLAQLLEMLGNEIRTAYDGEAGVRVAGEFRPTVVLCDIGMPVLNGYEAARRIRAERWGRDMVLVALTGWGQEDDRQKSAEAGFDFHLVKPVETTALMKLLAKLETATA